MDLVYIITIVLASLLIPSTLLKGKDSHYRGTLTKLILYHFLFSIVFYFFTRDGGGDAWTYWMNSKELSFDDFVYLINEERGTYFMEAFNYVPAGIMGMGFFANTILYGLFGAIGIACFFVVTIKLVPFNSRIRGIKIFPLLLYLPNLHFWSAGVGKDTLLFMCIGLFAYAMLKPGKRIILIGISLVLAYAVRPHVMLLMSVGFGFAYIISSGLSLSKRITFFIILGGLSIYILPQVMDYVKLDDLSLTAIADKGQSQASLLQEGSGSSVDVASYPFPLKMFTFLFRPLFFDAHNITSLIASVENIVLLYLVFLAFRSYPIRTYKEAPFVIQSLMVLLVIATFLFSQTLGNLGIMIRMRNMFLPGLLIYILWAFSFQSTYKIKR